MQLTTSITAIKQKRLKKCEEKIERGLKTFYLILISL